MDGDIDDGAVSAVMLQDGRWYPVEPDSFHTSWWLTDDASVPQYVHAFVLAGTDQHVVQRGGAVVVSDGPMPPPGSAS